MDISGISLWIKSRCDREAWLLADNTSVLTPSTHTIRGSGSELTKVQVGVNGRVDLVPGGGPHHGLPVSSVAVELTSWKQHLCHPGKGVNNEEKPGYSVDFSPPSSLR